MRISDWSSDVCSSDLLIEDFSEASGAYLVGGLIAGRGARPQWAGKAAEGSMSGVVFSEAQPVLTGRSEEHTSELQSLMRISYAVFCLKKKKKKKIHR